VEILALLLEHPGDVVTREELQKASRHVCGFRAGAEQCHEAASGGS
jgi:hypothetical protein